MRLEAQRRLLSLGLFLAALSAPLACRVNPAVHPATAAPEVRATRAEPIDVEHYAIELTLDPDRERIEGRCTVRLWAVEDGLHSVKLDFEGLEVEEVLDRSRRRLEFTHRRGQLEIRLAQPLRRGDFAELAIRYGGRPAKGLWFAGHRAGRATQVYTQGQCEDSRWWFPCIDDPADRATSEVRVHMPAHWTSVAAGELVDRRIVDGRRTDHWRMAFPHPPYLVTLVAGEFSESEGDWDGVPLLYLFEPGYEAWAEAAFAETGAALEFLSELTGVRYPYPKYSQACVENFPFGGMENISASTLTDRTLRDERGLRDGDSVGLVLHEVAHQWFGNLMTCRDWSHIWLNEGFATYVTLLYFEETRGRDDFRVRLRDAQEGYVASDQGEQRRPMVHDVYRDPIDLFFSGHAYAGGAVRLHLLRHVLGERAFRRGVQIYVADNTNRSVVTDDLQRAFEEASGKDLGPFFEQWFHSPGFPEFVVSTEYDGRERELLLTVEQIQDPGDGTPAVFAVPVDVELRIGDASRIERVEITQRRQVFRFAAESRPRWVHFDAGGSIPKKLRFEREPEAWIALAAESDDVNARRDAVTALAELARATDVRAELQGAIEARLASDAVPAVRIAAARALATVADPTGRAGLLRAAESDDDAGVRAAALTALEAFGPDAETALAAERAFDAGYSWNVMAAAASLRATAGPADAFEWLRARLGLASPHDQLRAALLTRLAKLDDTRVRVELLRWLRDLGAGIEARAAAARGLGRFARNDAEVSALLVALLDAREHRLRAACIDALAHDPSPELLASLESFYARSVFPTERRRIERVFRTAVR